MLELWVMSYLSRKMFREKIYEHQLIGLFSVIIPFIFKVITIVLFFCDGNNKLENGQIDYKYNNTNYNSNNDNETILLKSLFVAHSWLFPISFLSYFILNHILLSVLKKLWI